MEDNWDKAKGKAGRAAEDAKDSAKSGWFGVKVSGLQAT